MDAVGASVQRQYPEFEDGLLDSARARAEAVTLATSGWTETLRLDKKRANRSVKRLALFFFKGMEDLFHGSIFSAARLEKQDYTGPSDAI